MAYKYDIFVSYSHKGNTFDWVRTHFHGLLVRCLTDIMPNEPDVFVDYQQETGVDWPLNIQDALLHSRFLVAVLSAPYWSSPWCQAEWQTMREREKLLGMRSPLNTRGLIYVIEFADGEYRPPEAQRVQGRDLKQYGCPLPAFMQSHDGVQFFAAMREVADELRKQIMRAPEWQPDWPVITPPPGDEPVAGLPRL